MFKLLIKTINHFFKEFWIKLTVFFDSVVYFQPDNIENSNTRVFFDSFQNKKYQWCLFSHKINDFFF